MTPLGLVSMIIMSGALFGLVAGMVFLKVAKAIFPLQITISLKASAHRPDPFHLEVNTTTAITEVDLGKS